MPTKTRPKPKVIDLQFPVRGLHQGVAFHMQPKLTTSDCQNVFGYDISGRARGGQRPGFSRFADGDQYDSGSDIQCIHSGFVTSSTAAKFDRRLILIVVAGGKVFADDDHDNLVQMTRTLGSTSTDVRMVIAHDDSATPIRYAWMVDGRNYEKLDLETNDPLVNTDMTAWTASPGTLPTNGSEDCRLIARWRNRIVLSGLEGDGQNWFMSAVGDPEDFDYSPATTTATQAVAGNNSDAGRLGSIITALVPIHDDYMIIGQDDSISVMRGDPADGGRIDDLTHSVGVAWGDAWCLDELGGAYLFTTQGLAYIPPGALGFELKSRYRLDETFSNINLSTNRVRLAYDVARQGVWICITPITEGASTHYFYSIREDAFWPVVLPNVQNPYALHVLDGDAPGDRVVLFGGGDGRIRYPDDTADDDDGTAINAYVVYPPVFADDITELKLIRTIVSLGENSTGTNTTAEVRRGDTVEEAVGESATWSKTLTVAGRNEDIRDRAKGKVISFRLSNTANNEYFSDERVTMEVVPGGRVNV